MSGLALVNINCDKPFDDDVLVQRFSNSSPVNGFLRVPSFYPPWWTSMALLLIVLERLTWSQFNLQWEICWHSNNNILYLNTIGFKAQSLCGRVQSNLIKCRFMRTEENRSTRGKTSQSREENQQTQPTYDTESGKRTRANLVGRRVLSPLRHHCPQHNVEFVSINWLLLFCNLFQIFGRILFSFNCLLRDWKTHLALMFMFSCGAEPPQNLMPST